VNPFLRHRGLRGLQAPGHRQADVTGSPRLLAKAVAQAHDRLDVAAGGAQLEAQAPDVGVDAAGLDVARVAPDALQESLAYKEKRAAKFKGA